jgi:uncharacterized protein YbjT (DUF2867 family)
MAIHGNKSQSARTKALADFKSGDLQVLVATDIAARGIDIDQLPHVVNFELPNVPEDYVHRIGRTGRAGAEGEAISLVCVDEELLPARHREADQAQHPARGHRRLRAAAHREGRADRARPHDHRRRRHPPQCRRWWRRWRGLVRHIVDYAAPLTLPPADEIYIALGTTLSVAGSQAAFRAVDFDAVVAAARAARAAGIERAAVVSALGASAQSRVFYNRVKGEMERALRDLRFERLVVARPSLLAGARHALAQPPRRGERLALRALGPVAWMLPASLRPIEPAVVARAMRYALRTEGLSWQVLESGVMQTLGREPT